MTDTAADQTLRLKSVIAENVKGHEALNIEFGENITIFQGRNGVGKSSALDAVKNAIYGSANLSTIARVVDGEAQDPKVTIQFEGSPGTRVLTKTGDKTPTIKARVGTSAAFETIKKPGDYLRTITEASADPGKFLTAPAKDQLEMLLASLPVVWDQARADEIVGEFKSIVEADNLPMEHLYPLQKVAAIRASIFRARTGINVDEKAKRSTADQILRDAPAEIPEGVDERIAEKRAEIQALQAGLSTQQEAWRGRFREAEAAATSKRDAAIAAAKAAYDAEISEAKRVAAADQAALTEATAAVEKANIELTTLLRDQSDATKIATMHEQAAKFVRQAESLAGTADRMTAVLNALDAFRAELVSDIPIHGLSIEDGQIRIAGVKFEQVNTATRVGVAFSVATLRLKGLPLRVIFVDNLEALDQEHRKILYSLAKQYGVQLIGAERTEDPTLKVVKE